MWFFHLHTFHLHTSITNLFPKYHVSIHYRPRVKCRKMRYKKINVDCEAIRARIALKLVGLLSFMSRNALLFQNPHVWEQMPIDGAIHLRSHSIPLIPQLLFIYTFGLPLYRRMRGQANLHKNRWFYQFHVSWVPIYVWQWHHMRLDCYSNRWHKGSCRIHFLWDGTRLRLLHTR